MKAVTVIQPWAELLASGKKTIETRTHSNFGFLKPGELIAIHAGKAGIERAEEYGIWREHFGAVLAVAEVVEGARVLPRGWCGAAGCEVTSNRYGLVLKNIRRLPRAVPCRGAQGIWGLPAEVEEAVRRELGE